MNARVTNSDARGKNPKKNTEEIEIKIFSVFLQHK